MNLPSSTGQFVFSKRPVLYLEYLWVTSLFLVSVLAAFLPFIELFEAILFSRGKFYLDLLFNTYPFKYPPPHPELGGHVIMSKTNSILGTRFIALMKY